MNRHAKLIREAYYALERASDSDIETSSLLRSCMSAAREGERLHRRSPRPYNARMSVELAAMFFAVKWACDARRKKFTLAEAAVLRPDALYGEALGSLLRKQKRWPFRRRPEAADIDYSEVFWGVK